MPDPVPDPDPTPNPDPMPDPDPTPDPCADSDPDLFRGGGGSSCGLLGIEAAAALAALSLVRRTKKNRRTE